MARKTFRKSIWLTPCGAGLAMICFFLPWGRASCGAVSIRVSGPAVGGSLWGVLGLCALVLAIFVVALANRRVPQIRIPALAALTGALLLIVDTVVSALRSGPPNPVEGSFHFTPEAGGFVFLGSLLVAFSAAAFVSWRR